MANEVSGKPYIGDFTFHSILRHDGEMYMEKPKILAAVVNYRWAIWQQLTAA